MPFGPAADRAEAEQRARAAASAGAAGAAGLAGDAPVVGEAEAPVAQDDLAEALSAADFWGGSAEALHQPVQVAEADGAIDVGADEADVQLESPTASPVRRFRWRPPVVLPAAPSLQRSGAAAAVMVMLLAAVGFFVLEHPNSAPARAAHVSSGGVNATTTRKADVDTRALASAWQKGLALAQARAHKSHKHKSVTRDAARKRRSHTRAHHTARRQVSVQHEATSPHTTSAVESAATSEPASGSIHSLSTDASGSSDGSDSSASTGASYDSSSASTGTSAPTAGASEPSSTASDNSSADNPTALLGGIDGSNCSPTCH